MPPTAERSTPPNTLQKIGNLLRKPGHRLALAGSVAVVAVGAFAERIDDSSASNTRLDPGTPAILYTPLQANRSHAVSGAELTSEHGFSLYMMQPGDEAITVYEDDKTIFVGVRREGDDNISTCGTLSRWEAKKYDVKVLDSTSDNPCTIKDMNELKNRYNFGRKFNGTNKIDGTYDTSTDIFDSRCDDPGLNRYFGSSEESAVNKDPANHHGFEVPLRIDDGSIAKLTSTMSVHYRFEFDFEDGSKDRAARVRIDPEEINGLTDEERSTMNQWFVVDRHCLPDKIKMDGPDKKPDARRGKRPNTGTN